MTQTTTQLETGSAQRWTLDPTHSLVEFSAKHMMITTVRGRLGVLEGVVTLGGGQPAVQVEIDAASIDTGNGQRDEHLRSGDFLDVESHPRLTFRGTRVEGTYEKPGDRFRLYGELTIRGTTREVALEVTYEGRGQDPWGGERVSFSAETRIDRRDFGLTWNVGLEAGGVLVSHEVRIAIEAQAVLAA